MEETGIQEVSLETIYRQTKVTRLSGEPSRIPASPVSLLIGFSEGRTWPLDKTVLPATVTGSQHVMTPGSQTAAKWRGLALGPKSSGSNFGHPHFHTFWAWAAEIRYMGSLKFNPQYKK